MITAAEDAYGSVIRWFFPGRSLCALLSVMSAVYLGSFSPLGNQQDEWEGRWRIPCSGKQEAGVIT